MPAQLVSPRAELTVQAILEISGFRGLEFRVSRPKTHPNHQLPNKKPPFQAEHAWRVGCGDRPLRGRSFASRRVGAWFWTSHPELWSPFFAGVEVPTSYQKRGDLYAPYALLGCLSILFKCTEVCSAKAAGGHQAATWWELALSR